jgi:hypothetical protein
LELQKMDEVISGTPELEPAQAATQATETDTDADILSAIEDEAPASDEAPKEEPPAPRKLKVKIDGQELEVDEEEAAKGYQRQADYSRHMQALQAEKQQTEQVKARYQQQLEQFIPESVSRIQALQQAAEQYRQEGNTESLALVQYDLQTEYGRYQQANAERQRIEGERRAQDEQHRRQSIQRVDQALYEAIPEWKNPEVGQKGLAEVRDVISAEVSKYFGDNAPTVMRDMMDGLYGPMPFVWARKALLHDKLMAKVASRKAGKSEETAAPAPAQQVRSSGGSSKDPTQMNANEFAAWRKKQIANR